jgi:hypothetical protein
VPRKVLFTIATLIASAVAILGAISASAGVLDDVKNTVDDTRDELNGGGDGRVDLPGGGGANLPGGGDGTGVDLPGGGGINLGGGGGGSVITPPDTTIPPDDDGTDDDGTTDPGSGGGGSGGGRDGGRGGSGSDRRDGDRGRDRQTPREFAREGPPMRNPNGTPTDDNPTLTVADFGPAPMGVPNFVIDQFSIPPFLLPIYQACGTQYGIPWQVLASINRIETAFGTNLNVSSAGALGWMQFMPATWEAYGVDANNDGRKDPYNPVDAICAAARYLDASGGSEDLRTAIFAYNHADWYVDEVLLYARQYGRLPDDLISSLTGLTEGARFPVAADSRYADDVSERKAKGKGRTADRSIDIFTRERAPVVAVNDGVIERIKGDEIVLRDAYGNRFTYSNLGEVSKVHPVGKHGKKATGTPEDEEPESGRKPDGAAGKGERKQHSEPENTEDARERLAAYPDRTESTPKLSAARLDSLRADAFAVYERLSDAGVLRFDRKRMKLVPLEEGSKVVAGTVLGRVGPERELAPHVEFSIRPAGRGAPSINPKPILDGWKLLEATAIYRAAGKNPFAENDASAGQVLLMSKEQLVPRVLDDPKISIYPCGRQDVQTGQIDRRVLALLAYLSASGFRLGVTSLKCGHSVYTSSGNVSNHSTGSAVDIASLNGLPVLGNQGRGSITETVVLEILELQGAMVPDELISLMDLGGPSFAMSDHADHIHVGYSAVDAGGGSAKPGTEMVRVLKPKQWERLVGRIAEIDNPKVLTKPSKFSTPAKKKRASSAHKGE